MVWEVIRVFNDSFCGEVLYENSNYKTPNSIRREIKIQKSFELKNRQEQKEERNFKDAFVKSVEMEDPVGEVFDDEKIQEVTKKSKTIKKIDRTILKKRKKNVSKKKLTKKLKVFDESMDVDDKI